MGFDKTMEIPQELRGFCEKALEKETTFLYDFSETSRTVAMSAEQKKFDAVVVDLAQVLFSATAAALDGKQVRDWFQRFVDSDVSEFGTRQHVFCFDVEPLVWNGKRVEQQKRKLEKSSNQAQSYDQLVVVRQRKPGTEKEICAATRAIPLADYEFGLETPLPLDMRVAKRTPSLWRRLLTFIADLLLNHLSTPAKTAGDYSIVVSGFLPQSNLDSRQAKNYVSSSAVHRPLQQLEEHEREVQTMMAHEDPDFAAVSAMTTLSLQTAKQRGVQCVGNVHVGGKERVIRTQNQPAPPIGEADPCCFFWAAQSDARRVLFRSSDTDFIAYGLFAVQRQMERVMRREAEFVTQMWLDLSVREYRRFIDANEMWRCLCYAVEATQKDVKQKTQWLMLACYLTGNDFCQPMCGITPSILLSRLPVLLRTVSLASADPNRPPLVHCRETKDMVLDEDVLVTFIYRCLAELPDVQKTLKLARFTTTLPSDRRYLAERFDFLAAQHHCRPGRTARCLIQVPNYDLVRAHARRAAACLHYHLNASDETWRPVDAFAKCPLNSLPLYGFEIVESTVANEGFLYRHSAKVVGSIEAPYPFMLVRKANGLLAQSEPSAKRAKRTLELTSSAPVTTIAGGGDHSAFDWSEFEAFATPNHQGGHNRRPQRDSREFGSFFEKLSTAKKEK